MRLANESGREYTATDCRHVRGTTMVELEGADGHRFDRPLEGMRELTGDRFAPYRPAREAAIRAALSLEARPSADASGAGASAGDPGPTTTRRF